METIFSPHITSPVGNEIFNLSEVNISWDINSPPTEDEYGLTDVISYELEYTDRYIGSDTTWSVLKRRIPWSETSFLWVVGKQIKSNSVRIRIRSRSSIDGSTSDWSMSSGDFSINVFKLIPPAIVSPVGNRVYTDFVLIVLDESLTRSTFNQKVRYTLEYASEKMDISWTLIVKDLPVGQNVIRWDLEELVPSDDYILRLTAKNVSTSCVDSVLSDPDQIARQFVYGLKIQQPGMFFIDTQPPQAVLEIENSSGVTNKLNQTLNVFAEDITTGVEQIQIRECDTASHISLGDIGSSTFGASECVSIEELLLGMNIDFDKLISKPVGYTAKTQWTLDDKSGSRKLEALLTDFGGNTSLQDVGKVFISAFSSDFSINDLLVAQEQRDNVLIDQQSSGTVTIETSVFEVVYLVTSIGEYWVLEPFPRLVQTEIGKDLRLLFGFNNQIYIFGYSSSSDSGTVLRDDKTALTNLFDFPNSLSVPNSVAEFNDIMYVGLENGELWSYNGISFTLVKTFNNSVSTLSGDSIYLYIGLSNSSVVTLYDGLSFFESDLEN